MLLFHNITHVTVIYLNSEACTPLRCIACEEIASVCDIVRRDERPVKVESETECICQSL